MAVEVPELGEAHHQLWVDLIDLGTAFPGTWTVIGAHMVALYAWEAGRSSRPSADIDVVVDVRLVANATIEISEFLRARGYQPEISANAVAHLFRREKVGEIDLFVPDGLGARTETRTVPPNRTISVPGSTQALRRSMPVAIRSRDAEGAILRPDLLGAILIKLRAIEVDDLPAAQRADVVLLLQLVEDPDALTADLAGGERTWLKRHEYFADPTDPHWDGFEADDPDRAALVYRRLLG